MTLHYRTSRRTLLTALLASAMSMACVHAATATPPDQPVPLGGPRPAAQTIQAWKDRKFGMFIHFGLYSVAGGMWNGKRIDNGYSEQIVANGPLPMNDYAALAKQFDPEKFDADAIVALAKAAGMKFIVITAKHHDGFNMFRTAQTPYNIVDGTPYRRDVVKALADACARGGLAFGVYYSTIDWHHPGGNVYIDGNSNPITPAQEAFNVAQIKELLGGTYGKIAEIWFDMGKPTPAQSAHFARTVHDLQPQTMVSGRVWNYQGDFTVMGDNGVPDVAVEEPWQSPASIFPETWGYRSWQVRNDVTSKIHENIARMVRVVSGGGNYILNIGPEGDGSVVPYEADVLKGVGDWLKINGSAIYGSSPQPFASLDFGHATVGKHMLYLFVEKRPADGVLHLPGLTDSHLGQGTLLGHTDAGKATTTTHDEGGSVEASQLLAAAGDGAFIPVIAVPFEGELHVRPAAVVASADGSVVLAAKHAERFLNYNGFGYEDPSTVYKLRWDAQAPEAVYDVTISYKPAPVASVVALRVDGVSQSVTLAAGSGSTASVSLRAKRDRVHFPYAMRVELTPPEPFTKGTRLPADIDAVTLKPTD